MPFPKNVLIVGGGSIGNKHRSIAEACSGIGEVSLIGQREFDSSISNLDKVGQSAFIKRLTGVLPDLAIVAGPATRHLDTASIFVSLGIHTIVEKPLSTDTDNEGLSRFVELVNQSDVCVSVGYNLRFLPNLQLFKQMIAGGRVGRIYSVRSEVGQYLPDWRPETDYRQTVSANKSMGGGVLLELSHEIDYLQWIFGCVKSVLGSVSKNSDMDLDVEDTAHFILAFDEKKFGKAINATVNLDFVRRDPTRFCVAIGELGTLKWDGIADEVTFYNAATSKWERVSKQKSVKMESYSNALSSFLHCIDTSSAALVTVEDGKSVLNIIDAIRRSAVSSHFVNVIY